MSNKKKTEFSVWASELETMIKVADNKLQLYNYETDMKKHELSQLIQQIQQINSKKNFELNFDNEEGFIRIKEAARNEIESVMRDQNI